MNIKDLKDSLPYLAKAELTPFIWGRAGIGKTTAVKQWCKEQGYKFSSLYLGTQSDLGDILGLAEFVDNGDGSKSTVFAIPQWIQHTIEYCKQNPNSGAVIFLDEFNRGRKDILSGMFSLALDKTFHTLRLPPNCYLIAAGNPPTEDYQVTDVDETALMARFVHIKLEPSVEEWVTYAKDTLIESSLVNFIQEQPKLLEADSKDFQLPVKVDRRAYEKVSNLMKLGVPSHLLDQLMTGIIGIERTVAYNRYLKSQDKVLTAKEVLKGNKLETVVKWSNPENVQASFLNVTCDNIKEYFQKLDTDKKVLKDEEKINLLEFLKTIPKDISYAFIDVTGKLRLDSFIEFQSDKVVEDGICELYASAKAIAEKKVV
jgi:MoxR-like ATPase